MRVSGKSRHVASSRATTAVSGCVPALHMLKVVSTLSSSLSVATHQKRKGNGGREALLLVASMRELLRRHGCCFRGWKRLSSQIYRLGSWSGGSCHVTRNSERCLWLPWVCTAVHDI